MAKRLPKDAATKVPREVLKRGAQDDVSARTKNSGHKKKTADKWNQ